jgi:hypothetical protein
MAKAKVYGFTPWVDQVDAINQIIKETGERTESVLLRKLVDEALQARRKNKLSALTEESHSELGRRLETIEALLMRVVTDGGVAFRILDVCLALLQDVLAEAYATRRLSWESLVMPQLREKGFDMNDLEGRFALQTNQAREYAYGLAEGLRESQEAEMTKPTTDI